MRSGAAPGTRDPSAIAIVTGGGTWEIERGIDIRANQRVKVTRDEAWAILPRVFEALEIETDVVDQAGRRVGASQHRARPAS